MKKFYEKVCKLEELIALILVAGIAVLVFVSALMRTIGHPLNWAQDVALIAFAWLIFLGSRNTKKIPIAINISRRPSLLRV